MSFSSTPAEYATQAERSSKRRKSSGEEDGDSSPNGIKKGGDNLPSQHTSCASTAGEDIVQQSTNIDEKQLLCEYIEVK